MFPYHREICHDVLHLKWPLLPLRPRGVNERPRRMKKEKALHPRQLSPNVALQGVFIFFGVPHKILTGGLKRIRRFTTIKQLSFFVCVTSTVDFVNKKLTCKGHHSKSRKKLYLMKQLFIKFKFFCQPPYQSKL